MSQVEIRFTLLDLFIKIWAPKNLDEFSLKKVNNVPDF